MQVKTYFGYSSYQCLVLFAAWLGWGFDVFDALLFNYVARLCIPSLLGKPADAQTITHWTGIAASVVLVGWGFGGILFGKITDRIGRSRTLLITIIIYAVATAACALAPNIYLLLLFRFISSLGIGGEWAAGAALVAETVPEEKRVQAGALLYTAAPAGLFLATYVTDLFTRQLDFIASNPELSWRTVFLTGLLPVALAVWVRLKIKEPETWKSGEAKPRVRELFQPQLLSQTLGGLALATVALLTWWSCNAFTPAITSFLANDALATSTGHELATLKAEFVKTGTLWFNLGGLIGTVLTAPVAAHLGRRPMFLLYFTLGALSIWCTFQLNLAPDTRLKAMFFTGLTTFGIVGSFPFYLPELFPMRLRATGAGFCYNAGRFITAAGPFLVGALAARAANTQEILHIVSLVAIFPAIGVIMVLMGLGKETRGKSLEA